MGKGKPKKGEPTLGRALQKQRFGTAGRRTHEQQTEIYTASIANPKADTAVKLRSMTETSDLVELMHNAALAEADFSAQKANTIMITKDSFSTAVTESAIPSQDAIDRLRLPRRPAWTKEMSAAELDAHERAEFLEWRRKLAELEEEQKLVFTPFEKNLEVWRQLWRVVERSDIVLQIVDARNPLLFFSRDLAAYVHEVDPKKQHVVLVNKADFLALRARVAWARYFDRHNVKFLFWSANWDALPAPLQARLQSDPEFEVPALNAHVAEDEAERGEAERKAKEKRDHEAGERAETKPEEDGEDEEEEEEDDDEGDDEEDEEDEGEEDDDEEEVPLKKAPAPAAAPTAATSKAEPKPQPPVATPAPAAPAAADTSAAPGAAEVKVVAAPTSGSSEHAISAAEAEASRIYGRDELLAKLVQLVGKEGQEARTVVGTVGYPNVGKSSTINVLAGEKRVTVSSTPGKTKRFQTLLISDNITLVDCPGLVFPNLLASKAEMICNGLLPIDQMRDSVPPVSLVCDRIPRDVLEQRYGIVLPEADPPGSAPSAHDLLQAYGYIRGFMTAHGSPDESRAARLVLKDYVSGRLLFCHKPPKDDTPESLARSISPPLHHIPAPLFHIPRKPAPTARTPTMRQSTHEASFDRQASVTASTNGGSGGSGSSVAFTRITRPFSPVPLVRPAKKVPRRQVNLTRLAAPVAPQPSVKQAAEKKPSEKLG